jgi:DNA-binding response OmpR family regulator
MQAHQQSSHRIIILDDDLAFVLWLGHTLVANGYSAFPATSVPEALRLIEELQGESVDLVIANPVLPGVSELLDGLRTWHVSPKVIAIEDRTLGTANSDIEACEAAWLKEIRTRLESFPSV